MIIRDAVALRITGEATRISLGKNRFRVAIGGAIALEGLYIERSEESSALWIEGSATATNVTFRHCYVEALEVVSSYNSLLDHDGAYTSAKGAAIRLDRDASMELTGCFFHDCEARGGSGDASGGACRAQFSAFLQRVLEFSSPVVAGAIFGYLQSSMTISASRFCDNMAESGAGLYAIGGAIRFMGLSLAIHGSEFVNNSCISEGEASLNRKGGALGTWNAMVELSECTLRSNVVSGGRQAAGAAVYLWFSRAQLDNCTVDSNVAQNGRVRAPGGGWWCICHTKFGLERD